MRKILQSDANFEERFSDEKSGKNSLPILAQFIM